MADALVLDVYRVTRGFPVDEQIRAAVVSTAANIVEGSARGSTRDYVHFLRQALGSASEARYLLDVARRLELVAVQDAAKLDAAYGELLPALQALITALQRSA